MDKWDAMGIGRKTGMDIGVILKAKRTDVSDGELALRRSKTHVPVRYKLTDEKGRLNDLGKIIDEMIKRKRSATGPYLIQDDKGQGMPYNTFVDRFDKARTALACAAIRAGIAPEGATT